MNIIRVRHPYQSEQIPEDDIVLMLGFFDGVYIRHQKVIKTGMGIAQKEGLKSALTTFNQHPSIVFRKISPNSVRYLVNLKQKEEKVAALGTDYLCEADFTSSFTHLAPQEFVDQYVVGLYTECAVSGLDYIYGPEDIADITHFPGYAEGRFKIVTVSKEEEQGEKISSTHIRGLLDSGQVKEAAKLLGYTYEAEEVVVHGDTRGRLLGSPTTDVKVRSTVHLPKGGVYVSEIKIGETWYPAMGSIGHNDTFDEGRELTVELCILDFNQDIYDEHVAVCWNQFLRDQVKFSSVEKLIEQLKGDEQATAEHFFQQ